MNDLFNLWLSLHCGTIVVMMVLTLPAVHKPSSSVLGLELEILAEEQWE